MPDITDRTVEQLVSAGWTWIGPNEVDDSFELRIDELPDFLVAGQTPDEAMSEAPDALRAFLMSYVQRGDQLPNRPRRWRASAPLPVKWTPTLALVSVPRTAESGSRGTLLGV